MRIGSKCLSFIVFVALIAGAIIIGGVLTGCTSCDSYPKGHNFTNFQDANRCLESKEDRCRAWKYLSDERVYWAITEKAKLAAFQDGCLEWRAVE